MRKAQWLWAVLATLTAGQVAGCGATEEIDGLFEEGPPLADVDGKADGYDIAGYNDLPSDANLDRPLEVLFAPDDQVVTLEVEMISRVTAAREADPASYAEGDNPYRVRYAVYNLRNLSITEALIAAAAAGVDVQILIEADQLSPSRTWNTMDELLIESGFDFVSSHRDLSSEEHLTADLIGVTGSGLMHLKCRLFETPDWSAVLSGSLNPGDHAALNEETLHLIRDPAIIARYAAAYDAVRNGERIDNTWDDASPVNVLFTPAGEGPRAGSQVLEWLAEEDEAILMMVFSLRDITAGGTDDSLVEILAERAAAGVPVYVITDRKQSDGVDASGEHYMRDDGTEDRLRAAGVHVYEAINRATPYTAMHHKVAVLGLTSVRIISDAANWTNAGLGSATRRARNVESVLFIDSAALDDGRTGRRYLGQWLQVLARYADQSADDGEPSAEVVTADLMAHPLWPTQAVTFAAEAETRWGETVAIRGDAADLGDWGDSGQGHLLDTDGDSYPIWSSVEPAQIPLSAWFEWKIVILQSDGAVSWEHGLNRADIARPRPLTATDAPILSGSWR